MSLTLLVHDEAPVVIVRWFLEPNGLVLFANGPIIQMGMQEFRSTAREWVLRHFEDYVRTRIARSRIVKVFEPGEAAKFMEKRRAVQVHLDHQDNLIFSPMIIEKYDLADLKRVRPIAEVTIPKDSSSGVFWKTFDRALAAAPPDK